MRKCYLCGSVIRRRAEFCRFCTARQPGAHNAHPDGVAFVPPASGPKPWMVPAPAESAYATTGPEPAPAAIFDPAWDATDARPAEPLELDLGGPPGSRSEVESDPWVFDETAASATAGEPLRPAHPEHYPSTVTPRPPAAEPASPPPPAVEPVRAEVAIDEPVDDQVAVEPEPVVEPAPPGNGHDRAPVNGHGSAPPSSTATAGDASAPGTPLHLLRRSNGTNGPAPDDTNGRHGNPGPSPKNGAGRANGVSSAAPPPSPPAAPTDRDALAGFEYFPDAVAAPEVRWG